MPVYIFTFHAYRSWTEDNERGYVQRGAPGVQAPNQKLARHRAGIAHNPPVEFGAVQHKVIIETICEVCGIETWRAHGASVTPSHIHAVVSWRDETAPEQVTARLKRMIGRALSLHAKSPGNRWLSRGCDRTRVHNREHLEHLLNAYLPGHRAQRGTVWIA